MFILIVKIILFLLLLDFLLGVVLGFVFLFLIREFKRVSVLLNDRGVPL
jgi:hypothetical protein